MTQAEHMEISIFMGNLARDALDAGCKTTEEAFAHIYGTCEAYKHDFYLQQKFPMFFMIGKYQEKFPTQKRIRTCSRSKPIPDYYA